MDKPYVGEGTWLIPRAQAGKPTKTFLKVTFRARESSLWFHFYITGISSCMSNVVERVWPAIPNQTALIRPSQHPRLTAWWHKHDPSWTQGGQRLQQGRLSATEGLSDPGGEGRADLQREEEGNHIINLTPRGEDAFWGARAEGDASKQTRHCAGCC